MGFRRPFYAEGRLKVAWILYRTVAWALPTGNVCRNDGERSDVFPVFAGKALPIVPNGECQVWLTVFALSLALSHGERGSVAFTEMMANGMGFPVFVGEAHATTFRRAERRASGGFDCFGPLPNPLPRGEGTNGRESKQWSDFTLSPWEREQIAGNHNNS